jgi:hypothetical protein
LAERQAAAEAAAAPALEAPQEFSEEPTAAE